MGYGEEGGGRRLADGNGPKPNPKPKSNVTRAKPKTHLSLDKQSGWHSVSIFSCL